MTKDRIKELAFWAVQYAFKLQKKSEKPINKSQIDNYIEKELWEDDLGIRVEGNKGANYIEIKQLDERFIHLKAGDCCVHTINFIVSAEVFSHFLTQLQLEANKPIAEVMREKMDWDEKINEEFFKGTHQVR